MGAYLEITQIEAPTEARAGETVYFWVHVKNVSGLVIPVLVTATVDGTLIKGAQLNMRIDEEIRWSLMSFIMPNKQVTITASALLTTSLEPKYPEDWLEDDRKTFNIRLVEGLATIGTVITTFTPFIMLMMMFGMMMLMMRGIAGKSEKGPS